MWVTFQKYPRTRGFFNRTDVHVLEFWLYLTDDEKATITASGLSYSLFQIDKDPRGRLRVVLLADFMETSGPQALDFSSAFEAHAAAQEIKADVESVAAAIGAYDDGLITQEESFEL